MFSKEIPGQVDTDSSRGLTIKERAGVALFGALVTVGAAVLAISGASAEGVPCDPTIHPECEEGSESTMPEKGSEPTDGSPTSPSESIPPEPSEPPQPSESTPSTLPEQEEHTPPPTDEVAPPTHVPTDDYEVPRTE